MTIASVATASAVIASPSIAATNDFCSWPDLAARFERYHARWCRRRELDEIETEEDHEDIDTEWDEIIAEQGALARLILDKRPETMADVVLQARATAATNNELWTDAFSIKHADSGQIAFRRLVDRLCEFVGVEVFPDATTAPIAVESPTHPDHALIELGNAFDVAVIEDDARWEIVYKINDKFDWKRHLKIMRLEDNPVDRGIARLLGISAPCDFISPGWIPKLEELGPSCHADLKKRIRQISREQVTLGLWRQQSGRIEAEEFATASAGVAHDLAKRIVAMPASTIDGLRFKAKVFKWCRRSEADEEPSGTDEVAIFSMVEDLVGEA
ncbi:hypothetical protein [Nitrobacter sp.]|uniref:hypothetical protein n=1 Tax=Nitrobacter sp. TaxID=29420 RepID=UPI003F64B3F6